MRIYDNGIYRDATSAEIAEYEKMSKVSPEQEIEQCKSLLSASDYKAIKFAEGELSATDYEPIRIQRGALRQRINELEESLGQAQSSQD